MIDQDRFRSARMAKGLSQPKLAAAVGMRQSGIDKIERGLQHRTFYLPKLAAALGVPAVYLDQEYDLAPEADANTTVIPALHQPATHIERAGDDTRVITIRQGAAVVTVVDACVDDLIAALQSARRQRP